MQEQIQLEITCRQVWREISNYLEEDISPELRARLERHFDGCSHCRAIMNGARNTITLVANGKALELPAYVSRRLYSRFTESLKK